MLAEYIKKEISLYELLLTSVSQGKRLKTDASFYCYGQVYGTSFIILPAGAPCRKFKLKLNKFRDLGLLISFDNVGKDIERQK